MWIIGCDLHTRYQQVAAMNPATGELVERKLLHRGDEVEQFYGRLTPPVRIGIEATGYAQWFERLLSDLGQELWIGDASAIRASVPRQQKTDARDAEHLLRLLAEDRFPRIWVHSAEQRDARQLLLHRAKLVGWRTSVRNQLHALALGQGLRLGPSLASQRAQGKLGALPLLPWAAQRRSDLLDWHTQLDQRITALDRQIEQQAARSPEACCLRQQPGVGPITSLAFVLTLGPVSRFRNSKQVVSYLGLNPREFSSGGHQRLGSISKQGNTLLRWLLVEAGQTAARCDDELRQFYQRVRRRRGRNIAKVAVARKLAVRLYWRLRTSEAHAQRVSPQSSSGMNMVPQTAESHL